MVLVKQTLNTQNFGIAIRVLSRYSRALPGEALPRAVAFVLKDAKENTPFTTTSQIDAELSVQSTPVISARTGRPLKSGRKNYNVTEGGLATKVVLARLHPYSSYNLLTDRKYMLDRFSFSPGGGQAGFWAQVEAVAKRMVAARHSGTHFFQISWNAVLGALAPFVPAKYRNSVLVWAGRGRMTEALGMATVAGAGTPFATCVIENRLGMDSEHPTISAIRNMEAHRILTPVLQGAIDRQFDKAMQEIARRGLLDKAPELQALGFKVT